MKYSIILISYFHPFLLKFFKVFRGVITLGNFRLAFVLLCAAAVAQAETLSAWLAEGNAYGNVRYYYIETDKDDGKGTTSSAHANSVGGQLGYETASLHGLKLAATFMTTNPFALPSVVDTSIIGKDNGVRGGNPKQGFSVLGEAYVQYDRRFFTFWYGRKKLDTPLINTKDVRMLPSTVQGAMAVAAAGPWRVDAGYLDRFKQRTSDTFTNIVEHALGADTQAVTGHRAGYVVPVSLACDTETFQLKGYDYYSPDFMNALYFGAGYKHLFLNSGASLKIEGQYLSQQSIGNADDNLAKTDSVTGGEKLRSSAYGLKASASHFESSFQVTYTKVLRGEGDHDSLVLPWDGTPLFTNMITSNDLFQSLYGNAFKADSAYIGGTAGVKLGVSQGFDFSGIGGFKAMLAWAQFGNGRTGFDKDQQDINAVIGYARNEFSLALKGIWVRNSTEVDKRGTVSQLYNLTQYRVIANFNF